jgi:hypothetical protein
MADNNNDLAGQLPEEPYLQLKKLERLLGKWKVSGDFIEGGISFEWMAGGFFLIQQVDLRRGDYPITGVEYIGFDEDSRTLRSHFMDNHGSNFSYTWDLQGNTLRIWFGDKDSDNFCIATFSEDGNSYHSRWQWPEGGAIGGYEADLTRIQE